MSIERYNFGLTAPEIDKALQETHHILQRMTEFEQQSAECAENSRQAQVAAASAADVAASAAGTSIAAEASAEQSAISAQISTQYATQMKQMMGVEEVGDVAEKTFVEGSLVWHNDKLYIINKVWFVGTTFVNADVTETDISTELIKMKGVSTETVFLTINADAIPDDGVTARIYNENTHLYLPEVTLTKEANTVKLGDVDFGDTYTIIMPHIEGYVQPANPQYKAQQEIRNKTVTYVEISDNIEHVTVSVNNNAVTYLTVTIYDTETTITTIPVASGKSQQFEIPFGLRYKIEFEDVSGYITPDNIISTANIYYREITARYITLMDSDWRWVTKDFTYINIDDTDAARQAIADDNLFGVAYVGSSFDKRSWFVYAFGVSDTRIFAGDYWSKPIVDVPSATSLNNGQSNSKNALDAILEYEVATGETVSSMFKVVYNNYTLTFGEVEYHYFIAAKNQDNIIQQSKAKINTFLDTTSFKSRVNGIIVYGWYSSQYNSTQGLCSWAYGYADKDKEARGQLILLPLITTTQTAYSL